MIKLHYFLLSINISIGKQNIYCMERIDKEGGGGVLCVSSACPDVKCQTTDYINNTDTLIS